MASADAIVDDVLDELEARAGWDAFWEEIEPDIRKEIEDALRELVNNHLDGEQPQTRTANTVKDVVVVRKGDVKRLFDAYAITEGGYKFRLPLTGVNYSEAFGDRGQVALIVSGHRVSFEDVD